MQGLGWRVGMVEGNAWEEAKQFLHSQVEEGIRTVSSIAAELDLTHSSISRILDGTTRDPHLHTKRAIIGYYARHADPQPPDAGGDSLRAEGYFVREGSATLGPEESLLEYFLEHNQEMATFLSTTTEGLSAEDRRKVAVAIFNGYKKLAIRSGEKLPDWFFELERRFVAE